MACLCAPTTHEGSFRCRLHRLGDKNYGNDRAGSTKVASFESNDQNVAPCDPPPRSSPNTTLPPSKQNICGANVNG
eukprot:c44352_g1_i1 orf=51-278(-)